MNWRELISFIRRRFGKLIKDENLYYRFLALFLAIVLWFLAGGEERFPPAERLLTVPVQVTNLPEDLALVEEPPTVRVRIRAISPLLPVAERELRAVTDMENAIEGEGTYGVEVRAPVGVEVASITPRWIPLRTEQILEEEFPVSVGLVGLPPEQGIQSLLPDPAEVLVRAPRSVLQEVSQVVAFISLGGATSRLEGTFPVRATDAQGRTLDNVEIFPEEVRVVLQQVTQQIQLELPVIPQLQGDLPDGLELGSVAVNPSEIPVTIPASRMGEVDQLITQPLALGELEVGEFSFAIDVVFPPHIEPLTRPTVQVDLAVVETEQPIAPIEEETPEQPGEESEEPDVPEQNGQQEGLPPQDEQTEEPIQPREDEEIG